MNAYLNKLQEEIEGDVDTSAAIAAEMVGVVQMLHCTCDNDDHDVVMVYIRFQALIGNRYLNAPISVKTVFDMVNRDYIQYIHYRLSSH